MAIIFTTGFSRAGRSGPALGVIGESRTVGYAEARWAGMLKLGASITSPQCALRRGR